MRGRPPHISDDTILDAARDVFLRDRLAASTIEIARRAGVSEGILFYRFKTKEGLLAAVMRRETAASPHLVELCRSAGVGDVRENIENIIFTILDCVGRNHPFVEMVDVGRFPHRILNDLTSDDEVPPPVRDQRLIEAYLRAEMAAGRIRDLDVGSIAGTIIGAGLFFFRLNTRTSIDDRRNFARTMADVITDGMTVSRKQFPEQEVSL